MATGITFKENLIIGFEIVLTIEKEVEFLTKIVRAKYYN